MVSASLAALAPATVAAQAPTFRVAPAPAWVAPVDAELDAVTPEGGTRVGVYALLSDTEVRVSAAGVQRYQHVAHRIETAPGVETASELHLDFDPPYEKLTLHHLRVVRGGRAIDALRPREIHVIQQESDLSQRLYNGTLTAIAFLHDVRVGDVVDYAYSLDGQNPVLGGRFSARFALAELVPVHRLRVSVTTSPDRPLQVVLRAGASSAEERVDAGGRHYVWDLRQVPALRLEDATPGWYDAFPRVELTEWASFGEVAAWALPLFEARAEPSKALLAEVEDLRRRAPDDPGRLLAALRFVQDEVRYLGIELGQHSHEPHPPEVVLERRFGDCKDKARLLVTLLRGLGIEANAALVNPFLGRGLDDRAPSPLAFNHVIVRARVGGRTLWLDPTLSGQRGSLETAPPPDYERALVVAPDTTGLTQLPRRELAAPSIEEEDELDAPDTQSPATLRVTTTYRGGAADAMREEIASSGKGEVARSYLNYYARDEPSVVEAAPLAVTDDEAHATLKVVESYRIPEYWQQETKSFHARLILDALPAPAVALRTTPLRVKHPTSLVHRMRLTLPGRDMLETGATDVADASMSLTCRTSAIERVATVECAFRSLRDFVPASDVSAHLKLAGKMREMLSYSFTRPEPSAPSAAGRLRDAWLLYVAGAAIGGLALFVAVPFAFRLPRVMKKRAFTRRLALSGGEAPATALPVASLDELRRRLRRSRCACGASAREGDEPELGQVRLGERRITSARLVCASCGETRRLYYEVAG
jgi:transglutaminase-like putative cysteine protease